MGRILEYDTVLCYKVGIRLSEPLHIGSSSREKSDILIHPVTGVPFIQASSIAGAFRAYVKNNYPNMVDYLFGSEKAEDDECSRIRISDGIVVQDENGIQMELRPRVKLNKDTGTVSSDRIGFADSDTGHKFEMLVVGAGEKLEFSCCVFTDKDMKSDAEKIAISLFGALNNDVIQLGGQKSNGCGYFDIYKLLYKCFDMTDPESRKQWMSEDELPSEAFEDIKEKLSPASSNDYVINISGRTDGELLVKGIALSEFGNGAPDSMNMKNAEGQYIVPGSSFKGAIRNRMTQIAGYLYAESPEKSDELIGDTFGVDKKSVGNIYFYDTVIGEKKANDEMPVRTRIHIDKLTGGVIYNGNFNEKNIAGAFNIRIAVRNTNGPEKAEKSFGLLMLALRDMAVGAFSIGGGANVGKGYLKVDKISVTRKDDSAVVEYKNGESGMDFVITDDSKLIENALGSLK